MPPLVMGRDTPLHACFEQQDKYADGYKMAAELRQLYDDDPDARRVDRRRARSRRAAPPGRHPRGRGRDHPRAAHRVPPDPAQARARHADRGSADRHAVRDARRERARPAEDGLPRPAQPRRHGDRARPRSSVDRRRAPTSTTSPLDDPKTFELLRRADTIGVFQLEGGPMRALLRSLAPTTLRRRVARSSRCTGRARWRRTGTTSTRTARTAASR